MLIPGALLLFGCQFLSFDSPTSTNQTAPPPGCGEPGIVSSSVLEDTTRGYPYTFNVYLPPCYETEPERAYPVLYLVPGRTSSPETWFAAGADKVADELILNGSVPPFLIVTTENIDNDMFTEAILNDLVPYVESHYRILEGRNYHAVGGGSLGGIAAYRIVFRFPDRYASAGMFGSGLISGEEARFNTWLEAISPENKPRVFLNTGEGDPLMLDRARVMVSYLKQAGIESTLIVGDGGHNYDYWVTNLPAYFTWLAKDWQ